MRTSRHCNRLTARPSFLPARPTVPSYIATALIKPRAAMGPAETVRQMAEDMRAAESRDGGVSIDELKALGFTASQIKTYADDARTRAQQLSGAAL